MKIKIIRHSERLDFTKPLYWLMHIGSYWADSPLTTNGYKMARDKGVKMVTNDFDPRYIYSSPYNRTLATSTEINASFPPSKIIIEPLLAEHQPSYKHTIGLYPNGIPTTYNGQETIFSYPETYDNFVKRVHFIIYNLIEKNNNDFIIVTHGEVVKVFVNHIQSLYPQLIIDPGSTPYLTTLSFEFDKDRGTILPGSVKIE